MLDIRGISLLAGGGLIALGTLAGQERRAPADSAGASTVGPDVIVFDLFDTQKWGTVDGITGYSIGTNSCNVGDERLAWFAGDNRHPVIAQNVYRLKDGRFEQIGMSWVKHGFGALARNDCGMCEDPGTFDYLGVGCSDPYCADLNGNQEGFFGVAGLGPRSEVNASTGDFLFPYGTQGQDGNAIYKRIQVLNDDVDPALNEEALYFAEGHYVTPDDAAAGNLDNNASFRPLSVGAFSNGGWALDLVDVTRPEQPAIHAWAEFGIGVTLVPVDVSADGRFILAFACTQRDGDTWRYEYALHNLNSHRSARRFRVPVPDGVTVTDVGFHDVDHHSGEPYDDTDWTWIVADGAVTWETQPFDEDPNANALRWGTLYNFRFDADAPPTAADVTLGLFRPGDPAAVTIPASAPRPACTADLDGSGSVDFGDILAILAAWGNKGGPEDLDENGIVDFGDLLIVLGAWGPCA